EELYAHRRRDDEVAGVRIRECAPGSLERIGLVEDREISTRPPRAVGRREAQFLAGAPCDRLAALAVEHDLGRVRSVEPPRQRGQVLGAAGKPVDLAGAVRRRDDDVVNAAEAGLERDLSLDPGLAVIRANDHRIALEELVWTGGGLDQRGDRGVAPRER